MEMYDTVGLLFMLGGVFLCLAIVCLAIILALSGSITIKDNDDGS